MDRDKTLREVLLEALQGGHAHRSPGEITAALPPGLRGSRGAPDLPTPWQLLEHLRISQWDILEFSRDPAHVSPVWPGGYWPPSEAPPEPDAWDRSVSAFRRDLEAIAGLVGDSGDDLLKPFACVIRHFGSGNLTADEVANLK